MIREPVQIIAVLLAIETLVLGISIHRRCKRFFHFIPTVFWIYFLPMLAANLRLIDANAAVYQLISRNLLPFSLILLLLSTDLRAIIRLGRPALMMMLAGSFGIMAGMLIVFLIVKRWVGGNMWLGFGALSGSWIGGSANMIAVKEAIGTPDSIFAAMVIVDTIVPYVWMGLLIAASSGQLRFDAWNKSRMGLLNELAQTTRQLPADPRRVRIRLGLLALAVGVAGTFLARSLAGKMPVIKEVFSTHLWTIIIASFLGLFLSATPLRNLEQGQASRIGYFTLFFVLTTIGAKAVMSNLNGTILLLAAGFMVVFLHIIVLLAAGRILRAPMFLAAVASQANIGGVASAPVVAAVYQPQLASVGLLLAVFGNVAGTYLGIVTAHICRLFA